MPGRETRGSLSLKHLAEGSVHNATHSYSHQVHPSMDRHVSLLEGSECRGAEGRGRRMISDPGPRTIRTPGSWSFLLRNGRRLTTFRRAGRCHLLIETGSIIISMLLYATLRYAIIPPPSDLPLIPYASGSAGNVTPWNATRRFESLPDLPSPLPSALTRRASHAARADTRRQSIERR